MKILIADKFEAVGLEQLKQVADEVVCEPELKDDSLKQRIAEFEPTVLIVRSTKVQAPALDVGKQLKLVIRAGSGFDTIDIGRCQGARHQGGELPGHERHRRR